MAGHPGFAKVQSKIEGEGYSPKAAGAILASKTRNASPEARKENPNLKKVKGSEDHKGMMEHHHKQMMHHQAMFEHHKMMSQQSKQDPDTDQDDDMMNEKVSAFPSIGNGQ